MQQNFRSLINCLNLKLFYQFGHREFVHKRLLSKFVIHDKDFLSPKVFPTFQQLCYLRSVRHGAKTTILNRDQESNVSSQSQCDVYSTQPLVGTLTESTDDDDQKISHEVIDCVNNQINSGTHGRLFAVVHLAGKQFKITAEDMILVQANMPANIGEKLVLEKILLVGSKDFTLVGHPLLSKDMIRIEATVIEKTLSHVLSYFRMKPREQFKRLQFFRKPYTILRINSISFHGLLDQKPPVEGIRGKIF